MKKLFFASTAILIFISCTSIKGDEDIRLINIDDRESAFNALQDEYLKNPNSFKLSYDYAYALCSNNEYEEALKIVNTYPSSLRFLYLKLHIYSNLEKDVNDIYDSILSLDPGNTDILLKKAEELLNSQKENEARTILISLLERGYKKDEVILLLSKIDDFYKELI